MANRVFDLVAKFVGYGFCRSHAAAFAHIVYQTAYLKAHYPAAYMAAVLEHKPGFYPLHSVLEEARNCGVQVLPVDIQRSDVKYRLERGAIRIPLTQVKGLCAHSAAAIVLERLERPFADVEDLYARVRLDRDMWDALARAGALESFGARRKVLWRLGELARRVGPGGAQREQEQLPCSQSTLAPLPYLRDLKQAEKTAWDFATMGLTSGPHLIALHRPYLEQLGAHCSCVGRVRVESSCLGRWRRDFAVTPAAGQGHGLPHFGRRNRPVAHRRYAAGL